jgi:dTMP kinase
MSRAAFIVLDGLDGTGKSTQCRMLADRLRAVGHDVTCCVDPGGTALGGQLRELLLHHRGEIAPTCEALLFMASRAQLVHEIIRPALNAGHVVVCDRFLLANVVYQGYGGGLDVEQLWHIGRVSTGGLEPELTLVLDVPVEEALARRGRPADRMENRGSDYQKRVRDGFLVEARRRPECIRIIDARPPANDVHEAIWREVNHVLATDSRA